MADISQIKLPDGTTHDLIATKLRNADVRNDNQAPSWYMTNKSRGIVVEFKLTAKIGVNSIITSMFCNLITITPWPNNSGGRPVQIAIADTGVRAQRVATSDTAWGSWVTLPNTDTDTSVTQTATSTNADYEVLFSATADNTTRTETARKYSNFKFNPSTGNLQVTQLNGVTIGSSPKFTDTNTTYTIGISGNSVTLTPSGGTAQSITVPYATAAENAIIAASAIMAKKLGNYYSSRPTSANILIGDGSLITFQATSDMSTGYPSSDAHILHLAWDNTNGWDSQLAITNNTTAGWRVKVRALNGGTWSQWFTLLDSSNYSSYALPLSGGTLTGNLTIGTNKALFVGSQAKITTLGSNKTICLCGSDVGCRNYSNTNNYVAIYASAFSQQSSKLVKENITSINDNDAKKLLDIDVVSFDYIKEVGGEKNKVGMIAEDVLKIYPDVVNVPENYNEEETKQKLMNNEITNTLGIDYAKFTPYLIKMVQIQQRQIDELKDRIVALEELIEY